MLGACNSIFYRRLYHEWLWYSVLVLIVKPTLYLRAVDRHIDWRVKRQSHFIAAN